MPTEIQSIHEQRRFSYFKLLRLDFYILSEVTLAFIGATFFLLFIFLMFQALRLADFFVIHGASGLLLSKMTYLLSVSFMPTILPLAFLISVLVSFGRISSDSELIAMKACGMNTLRLAMPVFFLSILVGLLSLFLNILWVPTSVMEYKKTVIKISNTKVVTVIKEGTFNTGFFDLLVFADQVDPQKNELRKVFIYDEREAKNPLTYVAQSAEIIPIKTENEFSSAIVMRLANGSLHHNNLETSTYEKIDFDSYQLYLKIDAGSDAILLKPHMILQRDLLRKIDENGPQTYEGREYRGEYWRRFATALSPILFVLLGIGFGTFQQRTAKAGAILIGLGTLIFYWVLQTAGTAALLRGLISPFLAMQIPNFLTLGVGLVGFRRAYW